MTSSKTPKTGLASVMRTWMKCRTGTKAQRRFTLEQMYEELADSSGWKRQKLCQALGDFLRRGEVAVCGTKRNRRQPAQTVRQYLYVEDWLQELKGRLNRKIYKAMYVSNNFAVTDIQKLTGLTDRSWTDKIVRQLKKDGHIEQINRRRCTHCIGVEIVYRIVDRDRFKLEVMR